jgi:predicted dienelactone hydrolase
MVPLRMEFSLSTMQRCSVQAPLHVLALGFFLLAVSACSGSSTLDPAVAGPWPVGVTRVEFHDADRNRTLLTEVWYPAADEARGMEPTGAASYLPAHLESLADNATVPGVSVRDVAVAENGPWPLVLFSHGNNGIRFQNVYQMEHLASHGYVVAAFDHDGNTYFDSSADPAKLSEDRPLDLIYVLDQMLLQSSATDTAFTGWIDDAAPIGATGMSFGAFTVVVAAGMDDRIAAVLPQVWTGPTAEDYNTPTLLMLAGEDKTTGLDGNDAMRSTYAEADGPRALVEVPDAGHFSFSFSCYLGLGIGAGDGCGEGTRHADGSTFEFIESMDVWNLTNTYSAALFGRYLKGIEAYESTLTSNIAPDIMAHKSDRID